MEEEEDPLIDKTIVTDTENEGADNEHETDSESDVDDPNNTLKNVNAAPSVSGTQKIREKIVSPKTHKKKLVSTINKIHTDRDDSKKKVTCKIIPLCSFTLHSIK